MLAGPPTTTGITIGLNETHENTDVSREARGTCIALYPMDWAPV
jgi:hypothetical protein